MKQLLDGIENWKTSEINQNMSALDLTACITALCGIPPNLLQISSAFFIVIRDINATPATIEGF